MTSLLTVIVPVYKVEDYLVRCVESIIAQSYRPLEIILVDDGSPDNCGKICDELAEKFDIVYSYHKENGGLSSARNFGVDKAKGDIITFVDSDDYLAEKDTYKYCMSHFKDANVDIVQYPYCISKEFGVFPEENYHPSIKIYNKSVEFFEKKDFITNFYLIYNCKGGCITTAAWNKLYRRKIFDKIRFDNRLSEDEWFMLDCFDIVNKIVVQPKGLYAYCVRENSMISSSLSNKGIEDKIDNQIRGYKMLCELHPESKQCDDFFWDIIIDLTTFKLTRNKNYFEIASSEGIRIPHISFESSFYKNIRSMLIHILGIKRYINLAYAISKVYSCK